MDTKEVENGKKYIHHLKNDGKTEKEIIKLLSIMYTQKEITHLLNINVRRVKYLYKKYEIKKNDKYRMTRQCINCGEQVHISNFNLVFENGIPRTSRLCCWYCKREYWEQEEIKRQISTKEYEIEVLKSLLKRGANEC
jgi:hypothetical protein